MIIQKQCLAAYHEPRTGMQKMPKKHQNNPVVQNYQHEQQNQPVPSRLTGQIAKQQTANCACKYAAMCMRA